MPTAIEKKSEKKINRRWLVCDQVVYNRVLQKVTQMKCYGG